MTWPIFYLGNPKGSLPWDKCKLDWMPMATCLPWIKWPAPPELTEILIIAATFAQCLVVTSYWYPGFAKFSLLSKTQELHLEKATCLQRGHLSSNLKYREHSWTQEVEGGGRLWGLKIEIPCKSSGSFLREEFLRLVLWLICVLSVITQTSLVVWFVSSRDRKKLPVQQNDCMEFRWAT